MQSGLLLLWVVTLTSAEFFVNFDQKLEDRPRVYTIVKEEVGRLDIPAKHNGNDNDGKVPLGSELTARQAIDVLLGKRQSCSQGFGYCPSAGGCCVANSLCCSYGYCHTQGSACCPTGPCASGQTCCGDSHCMPKGDQCCSDESHCPAGNHCYLSGLTHRMVCCTDAKCTAHVEDGKTTYAPTTTSTHTFTTTYYQYYYWTVTWYYWYYYWTYSIDIQASIVTSSRSSTWTTFSVKTTDASAASEYFSSKSKTLSLPTPAAATSLESLAGSTSFVSPPPSDSPSASPSPTDKPSFSMPPQPTITPFVPVDGTDSTGKSKSSSSSTTTTTMLRSGGNDNGGNKGDGSSGAAPLWAGSDWKTAWILVLGAGTGLLAFIL
ncbi:carbohydrate-binding module family 18 [Trichoderma gracile]